MILRFRQATVGGEIGGGESQPSDRRIAASGPHGATRPSAERASSRQAKPVLLRFFFSPSPASSSAAAGAAGRLPFPLDGAAAAASVERGGKAGAGGRAELPLLLADGGAGLAGQADGWGNSTLGSGPSTGYR